MPDARAEKPDTGLRTLRSEQPILLELVNLLQRHPAGLRRWSVMRALRKDRESAGRDVPQKFEADVERIFRRFCDGADSCQCAAGTALFFRPGEKAGEVWSVHPERAAAWLKSQSVGAD